MMRAQVSVESTNELAKSWVQCGQAEGMPQKNIYFLRDLSFNKKLSFGTASFRKIEISTTTALDFAHTLFASCSII